MRLAKIVTCSSPPGTTRVFSFALITLLTLSLQNGSAAMTRQSEVECATRYR